MTAASGDIQRRRNRRDALNRLDWLIKLERASIAADSPGASKDRLDELEQIHEEVMALIRASRSK